VQQETTTVELRYTKQDYVGAQKLHRSLSIRGKWVCGLFIISSAAVALDLSATPSVAWYHSWAPFFVFVPIFTLVYHYCLIWFARGSSRRGILTGIPRLSSRSA